MEGAIVNTALELAMRRSLAGSKPILSACRQVLTRNKMDWAMTKTTTMAAIAWRNGC